MRWNPGVRWRKRIAIALACAAISFSVLVQSESGVAQSQLGFWQRVQAFFGSAPASQPTGRSSGGAGRGPICVLAKGDLQDRLNSILALMPVVQENASSAVLGSREAASPAISDPGANIGAYVGGYTVAAQPSFWFYLPYVLSPETPEHRVAQFVLLDDRDRPVWNELMNVELRDIPRLVEYELPYALAIGKTYSWYFSVICDSEKLSRNPIVRGWVQRIEPPPELQAALDSAPLFEKYQAYAEAGIWLDTVNSLVNIRRQFPSTNRDAWTTLLTHLQIPRADQLESLDATAPSAREAVSGSQFPART